MGDAGMDCEIRRRIERLRNILDDSENFMYSLVIGASPVLEGVKPASLLNFTDANRRMNKMWKSYRDFIEAKLQLNFETINETKNRSLVLFYNENMLEKYLFSKDSQRLLRSWGYMDCRGVSEYISRLRDKFTKGCPHEVGLFLGIPPKDVMSFIENRGKNYLFYGYWKVYHDPLSAARTFKDYDRAILKSLEKRISMLYEK